jgi:hypothetical protein
MVAAIRVVPRGTERGEKCLGDLPFLAPSEKKDTAQRDSGFFLAGFV